MATTQRYPTEERQVALADAALELIGARGITALTTRSLAAHVGLSSGALFKHFATLDELLDAVVRRVEDVLAATYPAPGLPARARLEHFVEARSAAVGRQLGVLRLVQSEQFRLALPKQGSERLARCVTRTRDFVRHALVEGQAEGVFRRDLDVDGATLIIMGTVQALAASPRRGELARAARATLFTLLSPVTPRARSAS